MTDTSVDDSQGLDAVADVDVESSAEQNDAAGVLFELTNKT